MRKFYKF